MSCTPEHCLAFTRHPVTEPAPPFRVFASPTEPHVRSTLRGTLAATLEPSMVSLRPRPNAWETAGSRVRSGASKATWAAHRSAGPSEPVSGHMFGGQDASRAAGRARLQSWLPAHPPHTCAPLPCSPGSEPGPKQTQREVGVGRPGQSLSLHPLQLNSFRAAQSPSRSSCVVAPTKLREGETIPSPLQRGR